MEIQYLGADARASETTTDIEPPAPQQRASAPPQRVSARQQIRYGGRVFDCSPEMARIFLKHARAVLESGDEELVPLLHSGGIELLFISRATPYSLDAASLEAES